MDSIKEDWQFASGSDIVKHYIIEFSWMFLDLINGESA